MKMQRKHLIFLTMWRGGLALAAIGGFYYGGWQLVQNLPWPWQLKLSAALSLAGMALVITSFVVERAHDRRGEGNLLQP